MEGGNFELKNRNRQPCGPLGSHEKMWQDVFQAVVALQLVNGAGEVLDFTDAEPERCGSFRAKISSAEAAKNTLPFEGTCLEVIF